MRALEPLELGLMLWAGESAEASLDELRSYGLRAGQLGLAGELDLQRHLAPWQSALFGSDIVIVTAVCSYIGESYADIPTVQATVGLVPPQTRAERITRTKAVADFAAALDIPAVACHIGFIPHDRKDPVYSEMLKVARDICDHCAGHGQNFALETGQETAETMTRFLEDTGRPNLKINFDPANLILYGTGDPFSALQVLASHVISVHCKDGVPPALGAAGALGTERRLGDGAVDIPAFLRTLEGTGYTAILSIEREEPDPALRAADIRHAVQLLKRWKRKN